MLYVCLISTLQSTVCAVVTIIARYYYSGAVKSFFILRIHVSLQLYKGYIHRVHQVSDIPRLPKMEKTLRGWMNDLGVNVAQTLSSHHHLMKGSCKCSDRTITKKDDHTRQQQQGSGVERMAE